MYRWFEERFYRGVQHNSYEFLTFTEATLIAPLIYLTLLYLPSVLYVLYNSWKFYDSAIVLTLDNPAFFIFPIFTCISFYETEDLQHGERRDNEQQSSIRDNQGNFS